MRLSKVSLFAQSVFYIAGGINHFWHEAFYLHVMPDHYAHPALWVQLTGIAEIAGGVGLLPRSTRRFAAIGIALMLVVFLDVHVFMLRHPERFSEVPMWVLWARLPLQLVLIGWALLYSRSGRKLPQIETGEQNHL
jgi:uncharacterized membrane protein